MAWENLLLSLATSATFATAPTPGTVQSVETPPVQVQETKLEPEPTQQVEVEPEKKKVEPQKVKLRFSEKHPKIVRGARKTRAAASFLNPVISLAVNLILIVRAFGGR